MTKLEQLDNTVIAPAPYAAPAQSVAGTAFRLRRGHWFLLALALLCVVFICFITFARSIQVNAFTASLDSPDDLLAVSADVRVFSWIKLPIGNRVMVLPGTHQLSVSAQGFKPLMKTIDVGAERYQQKELVLERLPGKLDISLQPAIAATVLLNGSEIGVLPGVLNDVPAGKHQLTIDAPLYRSVTTQVRVEGKGETESLPFTLQPAWAELSISSNPDNAEIMVDGQPVGATPMVAKIEEGVRKLTITAPKFKAFRQDVTVVAGQDLTIPEITLMPADGVLDVQTEPVQAAVIVNGEFRGVSPIRLNLPPNQTNQLQLYKAGYQLVSQQLSLAPEQLVKEQRILKADRVPVKFSVSPKDADIFVDSVKLATGSKTISLNTLPHQISVSKAGYQSQQLQIIPTRGNQQIVSIKLLTKEQYFWANIPNQYVTAAGQKMKLFKSPGKVQMGSSRREDGRRANEVSYQTELSKHFYVSEYEVSNKQFRAFNVAHSSGNYKRKSLDASKHPVVNVSWQQAALYCNWLSKKEGLTPFYKTKAGYVSGTNAQANGYRLPTEVEWAWLARNKDSDVLVYPWGNQSLNSNAKPIGNFADVNASELVAFTLGDYDDGYKASSPIGRYPKNHRGLYDMEGNVSEWVHDWYSAKGNSNSERKIDPLGPNIGEFHVIRGASWAKGYLPQLRLAYRDFGAKGKHDVGFRIARYVVPPK